MLPSLVIASVIVAAGLAGLFWWIGRRPVFKLQIRGGRVATSTGNVPDQYVQDVERICQLWQVESGQLIGRREGKSVRIICRGKSLQRIQTALQNAWANPVD